MNNNLRMELKRILAYPGIYISIIFGLALLLQEGIVTGLIYTIQDKISGNPIEHYTSIELYSLTLFFSSFILFAPLLATLPHGASFGDEYRYNYLNSILCRSNMKNYINSKVLSTGVSGFLAIFIPLILYGLVCQLFSTPVDLSNPEHAQELQYEVWSIVNTNGGFLYIFIQSFIFGLFGCSWALVSLTISSFISNKLIVYGLPLALCYFINYIFGAKGILLVSPYQSIDPPASIFNNNNAILGFIYMIGYQLIIMLIAIIVFRRRVIRRVKNG